MVAQKIFVTGGTGDIGRPLVKTLCDRGHAVFVLQHHRQTEPYAGRVSVTGDILKPESYEQALRGMDTVIHAAALTRTNHIADYFRTNTRATLDLIKACELNSVKRFIFISTRAISERGGGYSLSKFKAEEHVRSSSLDWVILRLSEVYDLSGTGGVHTIMKAVQKFPFVPVIGSVYTLCPVYIDDVAGAICSMVDREDLKRKIYLIAGPENFSYGGLADEIMRVQGIAKIKFPVPLPMLKMLLQIVSIFSKKTALVPDQLPRLLSPKSSDISDAEKDFGYRPRKLSGVIKSKMNSG